MDRKDFIKAASETNTKPDIKRFLKACDREFGGAVAEYRKNFVVRLEDGTLHAYTDASCVPSFYKLEVA